MIITSECMLYSYKSFPTSDNATEILNLRDYPIFELKKSNDEYILHICHANVKQAQYQFKFPSLNHKQWWKMLQKCLRLMTDNLLLIFLGYYQNIIGTNIAQYFNPYERLQLCCINKYFYHTFSIDLHCIPIRRPSKYRAFGALSVLSFVPSLITSMMDFHSIKDHLFWISHFQQFLQFTQKRIAHKTSIDFCLFDGNFEYCLKYDCNSMHISSNDEKNVNRNMQMLKYFFICYPRFQLHFKQLQMKNNSYNETFDKLWDIQKWRNIVCNQLQKLPSNETLEMKEECILDRNRQKRNYSAIAFHTLFNLELCSLNLNRNYFSFKKYNGISFVCDILQYSQHLLFSELRLNANFLNSNDIVRISESLMKRNMDSFSALNLKKLFLDNNTDINVECIQMLLTSIGHRCPHLILLSLENMPNMNDRIFQFLIDFYKDFYFNKSFVIANKVKQISLIKLSLVGCRNVSAQGLQFFSDEFFQSEFIELNVGNVENDDEEEVQVCNCLSDMMEFWGNIRVMVSLDCLQTFVNDDQSRTHWDKRIQIVV